MKNLFFLLLLTWGSGALAASLSAAIEQGNLKEVKAQIKAHKEALEKSDEQGDTALLKAVAAEKETIVQEILKHHPDLEHRNLQSKTALNLALMVGHQPIVLKLLKAGARPHAKDFLKAASKNLPEALSLMLQKNKALTAATDADGNTALHLAAREGSDEALRILLKNGIRKEIKNKKNQTARDLAVENKYAEAALILK